MKLNYLTISVIGEDRPGLVEALSKTILDAKGSIVDSRMTRLGGDFAMILLVSGGWDSVAKLEDSLRSQADKLDVSLVTRRTTQREDQAPALPYAIDAVSVDAPGLVHQIAGFLASRSINIEDLSTNHYAAAHTGSPMINIRISAAVPKDTQLSALREDFFSFCDEINIDAVLEPLKL